ncbi:MAG: hypothetical protein IJ057_13090 [Bacteroidales bacterium]|nr:hypothetical protein [Bacteroidales bacterium]
MNKVALKTIGFIEQNEVNDQWVQQQEQPAQRSLPEVYLDGSHWFKSIDQAAATLEESLDDDESGLRYTTRLDFTVRTEADMALAKKYARRPLVIKAVAVDGTTYSIGTKQYPVRMATQNRYDGMNTREIQISATYQSRTGVMN